MDYDPTTLMTEVMRYTRTPEGKPVQVRVNYTQVDPAAHPEAMHLPGMPKETYWAPSTQEVPEGDRLSEEEYAEALQAWHLRERQQARQATQQLLQQAERLAERRIAARVELQGLGLSAETVEYLLGVQYDD